MYPAARSAIRYNSRSCGSSSTTRTRGHRDGFTSPFYGSLSIPKARLCLLLTKQSARLLLGPFVAAELGRVGVGRGAGTENPADDDTEDEDAGNVEEVGRSRHQVRPRRASDCRRSSSRCTTPSLRATERT